MFKIIFFFTLLLIITLFCGSVLYSQNSYKWKFGRSPVWSDEFNEGEKLDSAKWSFETGGDGWGNNELQYYTKGENIKIEEGVLKIIALKEKRHTRNYSSSRIVTKDRKAWLYGRVIIKARMPKGRGTWPAFWMLPVVGFNAQDSENGEIDILEYVGFEPDIAHFSVHTKAHSSYIGSEKSNSKTVKKADTRFHSYRMDWTPYGIRGYIDGKKYFEYKKNDKGYNYWPFDKEFFLIINLAIGGIWGGLKGVDNKIFPATLEVDYVRLYKFLE